MQNCASIVFSKKYHCLVHGERYNYRTKQGEMCCWLSLWGTSSFIGKSRFTVALLFFVLDSAENKQRRENSITDQLGAHAVTERGNMITQLPMALCLSASLSFLILSISPLVYLCLFDPIHLLQLLCLSLCPSPSVSYLAGAHRAPIAVQHPDLPTVLDLVVMDTVACAVVTVGAPAVVASVQVEAHCVVGTGVPPRLAFINICGERKKDDIIHMLSAGLCVACGNGDFLKLQAS